MRICYAIPGAVSSGPLGAEELVRRAEFLRRHAAPRTEIEVRDNPDGPASIESAAEEMDGAAGLVRRLPELEAAGYDALVIGCFSDPGLAAARELVRVPVIGPAQASMHLAAQLGDRFGILTVVQEVLPMLRRLSRVYGLESSLASLRAVEVPVLQLSARRAETLDALALEGRRALDEGAEALILGCMTMGFLDVTGELGQRLGAPVINPVLAALHTAEAVIRGGLGGAASTL